MNIVIGSYPTLFIENGGLENQVLNTVSELRNLGHNVLFLHEWLSSRCEIDVYHHFSIHPSSLALFFKMKQKSRKTILSPIFQNYLSTRKKLVYKFFGKNLNFQFYKEQVRLLKEVDEIVFLGNYEKKILEDFYSVDVSSKSHFIPNGILLNSVEYSEKLIPEAESEYIVCVGTICERKNQYSLIKACNELKVPLKIIGGVSLEEKKYFERCKDIASGTTEFCGFMDNQSPEFYHLLKEAKCFVLPSFSEVLPISVFEALSLNVPVVVTNNSAISEYVQMGAFYCVPTSLNSIKKAINEAMNYAGNFEDFNYTWATVAKNLEDIYS